jgi:hypothetical protein
MEAGPRGDNASESGVWKPVHGVAQGYAVGQQKGDGGSIVDGHKHKESLSQTGRGNGRFPHRDNTLHFVVLPLVSAPRDR